MRSLLAHILLAVCLLAGSVFLGGPSPMAMADCPAAGQMAMTSSTDCDPAPMTRADCLAACGLVWAEIAMHHAPRPAALPRPWSWSNEVRTGSAPPPALAPPRA
jgi:hypothetical protein